MLDILKAFDTCMAFFFGRGNLNKFLLVLFRLVVAVLKSFILINGGGRALASGEENAFLFRLLIF